MIYAGGERQPNGPGSWVEGPLPVFFVLPFVFCSFLFPLYAHQLPRLRWMVSPSSPIVLSLSLFLALVACRPRSNGTRYIYNIYIIIIKE